MPAVHSEKKRVLIVDDMSSTRRLFCRFFELEGWYTASVSNAEDAVSSVKTGAYALVLTDANLGSGPADGIALAQRLHAFELDLRIIIMSGDRLAKGAAKKAGFNEFLKKGAGFGALKELLSR